MGFWLSQLLSNTISERPWWSKMLWLLEAAVMDFVGLMSAVSPENLHRSSLRQTFYWVLCWYAGRVTVRRSVRLECSSKTRVLPIKTLHHCVAPFLCGNEQISLQLHQEVTHLPFCAPWNEKSRKFSFCCHVLTVKWPEETATGIWVRRILKGGIVWIIHEVSESTQRDNLLVVLSVLLVSACLFSRSPPWEKCTNVGN